MTGRNRTAIVTGASRGIGAAVAVALARRGISPALLVRDPSSAAPVADEIRALGVDCRVQACDVSNPDAVQGAIEATLAAWTRIDVVVNNAGRIDPIGIVGETDAADWMQSIAVNLNGPYLVARAALPALLRSDAAAIVNVSTGAAHAPREGWSAYCSAKAGLAMLTRCLWHEYGPRGIATFGLQPGLVDTDMQVRIRASGINEISQLPRTALSPPAHSAAVIAWLADARPMELGGQDLNVRDETLVARARV